MTTYKRADTKAQWFADNYPGSHMSPNVVVLHTTETTGWPSYDGGATAPNYTALPDFTNKRLTWRAHYPDEMSARALRNLSAGVETNTLNAVQVELVGTCDPATHKRFGSVPHIFWPEAPEWALDDLAAFLADQNKRHGLKLQAPDFLAYPASYGNSAVRFTFTQWRNFYGVCGHQHVPENVHGDPGDLPIAKVLDKARALVTPERVATPKPLPVPTPTKPTATRRLTIRLANLWRENPAIEADLFKLLGDRQAHLVNFNEGGDFTDEIRAAAQACRYQVYGDEGTRAERMNPIAVRNDLRVFHSHVYKMCEQVGRPPHVSPARHATAVMFQFGADKRVHINTHANSHVQHGNQPHELPRVSQYVAHMRRLDKLVREGRRHGWKVTVSGDLNWSYSARILGWWWSPRRTFKRLGMRVQWAGRGAPQRGSHGRRRIDYIAHDPTDLAITSQRLLDTHSDHRAPEVHYTVRETL